MYCLLACSLARLAEVSILTNVRINDGGFLVRTCDHFTAIVKPQNRIDNQHVGELLHAFVR